MELAIGKNISGSDVITIARLASASGLNILLKIKSSDAKLKILTSFAGIMFILEFVRVPQVISSLIYASENGKYRVIDASAIGRNKWKITLEDPLGNQKEEILNLPIRFFVSRANFKYLSFPVPTTLEVLIRSIEENEYEIA